MLKLYFSSGACALASHIALEEAGADYDGVSIDLKAGQQKTPEYLAINPAGVTPALETDRGVITQNTAILDYVARTHADKALAPLDDAFEMARFNAANGFFASSLHPAIGKVLFSKPPLTGDAKAEAAEAALVKYRLVEDHLLEGPWVRGERWSLSDGYLSVFTRWARQARMLDTSAFPGLNDHLDRVQARPAVRRALKAQGIEAV